MLELIHMECFVKTKISQKHILFHHQNSVNFASTATIGGQATKQSPTGNVDGIALKVNRLPIMIL